MARTIFIHQTLLKYDSQILFIIFFNLSIKRLEAKPQRENAPRQGGNFRAGAPRRENAPQQNRPARPAPTPPPAPKTANQLFEEKLKQFMTESDSKISSIRQYSDHRTKSRRR